MLTMETSLKKILCCELTAGILSTLSEIQINIVNYQPKEHAHRENCIHVVYFQKQLKIFQVPKELVDFYNTSLNAQLFPQA